MSSGDLELVGRFALVFTAVRHVFTVADRWFVDDALERRLRSNLIDVWVDLHGRRVDELLFQALTGAAAAEAGDQRGLRARTLGGLAFGLVAVGWLLPAASANPSLWVSGPWWVDVISLLGGALVVAWISVRLARFCLMRAAAAGSLLAASPYFLLNVLGIWFAAVIPALAWPLQVAFGQGGFNAEAFQIATAVVGRALASPLTLFWTATSSPMRLTVLAASAAPVLLVAGLGLLLLALRWAPRWLHTRLAPTIVENLTSDSTRLLQQLGAGCAFVAGALSTLVKLLGT